MCILTKRKTNKQNNNIENRKSVHKNLCLIYHLLLYLVEYFWSLRHFLSIVPQTLLIICPQSNNRQILIALSRLLIVCSEIVCYRIITFTHFTLISKERYQIIKIKQIEFKRT